MSSPTNALIEEYFVARLERQNNRIEAIRQGAHPYGFLAVKAAILSFDQVIYIHVLRARDLTAMDTNGLSDPYVKVELMPRHLFPDAAVKKTQIVKKTLNPVWGEELTLQIPNLTIDEAVNRADFGPSVCIRLTVMDHDLISRNDFEGECFLSLRELSIIDTSQKNRVSTEDLNALDIQDMPLTQPLENDEYLSILEKRAWDSDAQKFASEQRRKQIVARDED